MKKSNKITNAQICAALSRQTGYDFRPAHLAVLVACWRRKHPDQAPSVSRLSMRKHKDGFLWFSREEVAFLAQYAGYPIDI